jgi:very-short-patch-repair endonuclease
MAVRRRKRAPAYRKSTRGSLAEQQLLALFVVAGLPPPMREVRVVAERLWRYDFAWLGPRVCVELHGSTYNHGRHVTGRGFNADREKMNAATGLGWKVLEYTTDDLRRRPGYIVEQVAAALCVPVRR